MIPTSLVLLTLSSARGSDLGLADALRSIEEVRSVRIARARVDSAEGNTLSASAAWDPLLTTSVETSANTTSGFLAGFPVEASASGTASEVVIEGQLPTSTSWSVSSSLGYARSTNITSLIGSDPTEQTRSNWDGLVSLSVTQDLLAPWRRSDALVAARQSAEALELSELAARQAVEEAVLDVANRWWIWSAAHRDLAIAERAVAEAEALEATTTALADEGRIAPAEVSRVTADRLAAQQELVQARANRNDAANQLAVVLGRPLGEDLAPGDTGSVAAGSIDRDAGEALALSSDLDVMMAQQTLASAEAALRDARQERIPTVDLAGSVGVASLADDTLGAVTQLATDPLPRWGIGLEVGLPLGNKTSRGVTRSAQAEVDIARLQLLDAEDTVRATVRAALDQVDVARQTVLLTEARLASSRLTESAEQARVDEGESRLDDLLEARNDRLQAEGAVVDAEMERAQAELVLLRRLGRVVDLVAPGSRP